MSVYITAGYLPKRKDDKFSDNRFEYLLESRTAISSQSRKRSSAVSPVCDKMTNKIPGNKIMATFTVFSVLLQIHNKFSSGLSKACYEFVYIVKAMELSLITY